MTENELKALKFYLKGLVPFLSLNVAVMVTQKVAKCIVNAYYNPKFPSSMGRLPAF